MAQAIWNLESNSVVLVLDEGEINTVKDVLKHNPTFLDTIVSETLRVYARQQNEIALKTKIAEAQGWGRFDQPIGEFRLA